MHLPKEITLQWFQFSDRESNREKIEQYLRIYYSDPTGTLQFVSDAPVWTGAEPIQISYSHSGDLCVLAHSRSFGVGIDLESQARVIEKDYRKIAERFFSESEKELLKALSEAQFQDAFLDLWTKKEAYAKLTRTGLSHTLKTDIQSVNDAQFFTIATPTLQWKAVVAIKSH
jgi:phosphopantetheinyl transferase